MEAIFAQPNHSRILIQIKNATKELIAIRVVAHQLVNALAIVRLVQNAWAQYIFITTMTKIWSP